MVVETKIPTLEELLEHSALFDRAELWNALKKRFKSVKWKRSGSRPKVQIHMLHEIESFKAGTKILEFRFELDESLTVETNFGTLRFR